MKRAKRTDPRPSPPVRAPDDSSEVSIPDRGALLVAGTVLVARLLHALATRFLFDDTLITARYGRNLAHGLGLTFNAGETSYGFTSPIWVALSALGTLLHVPPHAWLAGWAIACDVICAYLAASVVRATWSRIALASLLAAWPVLTFASVGGMETSLLGLCAVAWWTRMRPLEAAALAPLVRPEGWFLVVAHLVRERRPQAVLAAIPGALWLGSATVLFGSPLPLSAEAKRIVYGGPTWQRAVEWLYHLGQVPITHVRPAKTGLIVASASFWITALAFSRGGRGWGLVLAIGWLAFLIVVGAPLFEWYLALPSLLLIVSACRSEVLARWRVGAAALALNAALLFVWSIENGSAERRLLDRTWGDASRFVTQVPGARTALAEAVGILGWEFPGTVYDEVGIVTERMGRFRQAGDGWYYRAVDSLAPDVLLVRPYFHYRNQPVSGPAKPFNDERQFEVLGMRYVEVADFVDTTASASREVSLVRVLVKRELAESMGQDSTE